MRIAISALFVTAAAASLWAQATPMIEKIEVSRVIIDTRVTNNAGEPILGLQPGDFRVRIDDEPAGIESVDWITESRDVEQFEDAAHIVNGVMPEPRQQGRLFVIFVQTDFGRARDRVYGQMAIPAALEKWLGFLEPGDQVAVFSFDSHLKFRLDFSGDLQAIERAVKESIFIGDVPLPTPALPPLPSLVLDQKTMHDAARPEDALHIIGDALLRVPGPKSMIFICWGLGHVTNNVASDDYGYELAVLALQQARVTVFSIDMMAGHGLSFGLQNIAADTGGFYATSAQSPAIAIRRLHHTLGGHYEIEVRRPPSSKQHVFHSVVVEVPTQRHTTVMGRRFFAD
jgi:VWFA-related protein